jgi:molybdopterin/thiamine biosynthesis adenylyltransferase
MLKARSAHLEHEPSMQSQFASSGFYSRQTILSELGAAGQEKLRRSKVTIVGLGGLGSVSALLLALAGVGTLRLVDQDTVELNNLHRQILYDLTDLRYPKVEAAARRIGAINPEVKVEPMPENLNSENFGTLLAGSNCVVDGLDNMQTRYLVNRYCVETKTPFIFGGAIGMEGNVAAFKSPETPCLECVLPGLNDAELPTCDTRGVLGATAGIVGAIQAMEATKVLADIEPQSKGRLLIFDFAQSEYRAVDLKIRSDCEVCQIRRVRAGAYKSRLAWLCGSDTANVNPETPVRLNLQDIAAMIEADYKVILRTPMVLVFLYNGHEISLFEKGRMLIKNVHSEDEAHQISKAVAGIIGR